MIVKGQKSLISNISRIFKIFESTGGEVRPHFILTGPSGSGKSLTILSLCKDLGLSYIEINAAQLTKEGTSGNSLSKALSPLGNLSNVLTVCFVDEFDKLFVSGNSNSELAHESTNGVQNEFLKVLESDQASVFGDYGKYINISVKKVLFVFAGAFNNEEEIDLDRLRELGLKTEFLGRVGLVYNTKPLNLDNLYEIFESSRLLNQYLRLFPDIDPNKVKNDIKAKIKENYEQNTLGARMIHTLIHTYFINGGFQNKEEKKVTFQKTLSFNENE